MTTKPRTTQPSFELPKTQNVSGELNEDELKRLSSHFTHAHFNPNQEIPMTPGAIELLSRSNQQRRELLGVNSLDPFVQHSPSPRKQMSATQYTQHIAVKGATERVLQTGAEREYAKYLYDIKSPGKINVIEKIDLYPETIGKDNIRYNPLTVVVYEDQETLEAGIIDITEYRSNHGTFGFRYRNAPGMQQLRFGGTLDKDEVIRRSPGASDEGVLQFGVQVNCAHMSIPGTAEDGYVVSESFCKKMTYYTYNHISVDINDRELPLFMYPGSDGESKIFPDIGEGVRSDGLLMAVRPYSVDSTPYDHSPHGLKELQIGFDKPYYVPAGGRVVDIRVIHEPLNYQRRVPHGMDNQLIKYQQATLKFYSEVLSAYRRLKRLRGDSLKITPSFNQLIVQALLFTDTKRESRIRIAHRNARIENWRIQFTIEYENVPGVGFKIAGDDGDKGTIVGIMKDEDMPTDKFGNRADLIGDPLATVARSIIGRVYGPKYTGSYRDSVNRVKAHFGLEPGKKINGYFFQQFSEDQIRQGFQHLLDFYRIISPNDMYVWFKDVAMNVITDHLVTVFNGRHVIYLPTDNEPESPTIVRQLNETHPMQVSEVRYRGNSGKFVWTREKIPISSAYIIGLDKTGTDYAAVNTGRLQIHGVIAQLTNTNKHTSHVRLQAPRFFANSEGRIMAAVADPETNAEIVDRNNNRITMEEMVRSIYRADDPMKIEEIVDRKANPIGNNRPLQLLNHTAECFGWKLAYKPYVPQWGPVTPAKTNGALVYPEPKVKRD